MVQQSRIPAALCQQKGRNFGGRCSVENRRKGTYSVEFQEVLALVMNCTPQTPPAPNVRREPVVKEEWMNNQKRIQNTPVA